MSEISSSSVVRCAIYVRSACGDVASLAEQERICREAIAGHPGWQADEGMIFRDSGASGRTMSTGPGLAALLARAHERGRAFDLVVVPDGYRLSRDLSVVSNVLSQLKFSGVGVFVVAGGMDIDQLILFTAYQNEIAPGYQRQHREMVNRGQKARLLEGYGVGGRRYGYASTPRRAASSAVVGVRLEIVEAEATIVRRIYKLYADGMSAHRIAHLLNTEGVAAPGRTSSWSRRSVIRVLRLQLYRGWVIWNRTRRLRNPETGRTVLPRIPEDEVIREAAPQLRIVDDQLDSPSVSIIA